MKYIASIKLSVYIAQNVSQLWIQPQLLFWPSHQELIVTLSATTFWIILGKNIKIPPTRITFLLHAHSTHQRVITGKMNSLYQIRSKKLQAPSATPFFKMASPKVSPPTLMTLILKMCLKTNLSIDLCLTVTWIFLFCILIEKYMPLAWTYWWMVNQLFMNTKLSKIGGL